MLVTKMATASIIVWGALVLGSQSLMTPHDLQAIPFQPAVAIVRYVKDVSQLGELKLPVGNGPHPLVVLIHGGCFKAAYATLRDCAPMADALKKEGIATWNI